MKEITENLSIGDYIKKYKINDFIKRYKLKDIDTILFRVITRLLPFSFDNKKRTDYILYHQHSFHLLDSSIKPSLMPIYRELEKSFS